MQTMFFLGIYDGTHDAGAVLLNDGRPILPATKSDTLGKERWRLAAADH